MALAIQWRRPFTRLESSVYAVLFAVLVAVFVERSLAMMELAERTAMEVTVNNVNSALNVQLAARLLTGAYQQREKLLDRNPFQLADMRVDNLHPDIEDTAALAHLERGYWVYDRSHKELIYLPQRHAGLRTDDSQAWVRFRLVRPDGRAYALVPASRYTWE